MRCIDADALLTDLNNIKYPGAPYVDAGIRIAVGKICDAQTIEPERKTGRWIEDAETYYKAVNEKGGGVNENTPYFTDCIACSECLSMFSVIDNETERFDFCQNCGAKMEDERKE